MGGNAIQRRVYNSIVVPVAYGALSAASLFHGKLRETFATRRDILERWKASRARFSGRPVWFHVASVGEYEQAKPVISRLHRDYPDVPVALTFTSPSGYTYASRKETVGNGNNIKFMEYLPLDFERNARFCVELLNPRLLVFVKFDLWPNLVWQAAARRVPSVLIDATLSATSYRVSMIGRNFYRTVYSSLERILAISDSDARRFTECVPEHAGISVAGDTRFDRVMERKRTATAARIDLDTGGRFVVIAGSTWPKDEVHVLPALLELSRERGDLLMIIAPHEPTPERVAHLLGWAESQGLEATPLSRRDVFAGASDGPRVLVVDSVGVLAEAYGVADVAYIGGSFSTGVHSVIEPAIMGIPVLFGPVHENSFEATELLRRDAAFAVTTARDAGEKMTTLRRDEGLRRRMGRNARAYVESQLGATDRCMQGIQEYL
jgi:3-deoxy-D-manno-octulosonic-acid transferase